MIFQLKAERNYHIFYQILSNKKPELLGEPCQRSLLPLAPPTSPAVQGGPLLLLTCPTPLLTCPLPPSAQYLSLPPSPWTHLCQLLPPFHTLPCLLSPSFYLFFQRFNIYFYLHVSWKTSVILESLFSSHCHKADTCLSWAGLYSTFISGIRPVQFQKNQRALD